MQDKEFVGMRKIKLASPASDEPSEEDAFDLIVFEKDENEKIKLKTKSKQLKRPPPTTIEELLQITNNDSIVA